MKRFLLPAIFLALSSVLANAQISQLPSATLPLTGNEFVAIEQVQGSNFNTVKSSLSSVIQLGGVPTGPSGSIQFNNNGVFGSYPVPLPFAQGGTASTTLLGAQTNLDQCVTAEAYGAVGDGTTNDTAAIQAALTAGGRVCLVGGKTYSVTTGGVAALHIPSNTSLDCRLATLKVDDSTAGAIGIVQVGIAGTPLATELAASNVEVSNCKFLSNVSQATTGVIFQPGSKNVRIHHNDFRTTTNYAMTAAVINVAHLDSISIADNTGNDIRTFVNVVGDERQVFHHLAVIPNGSANYTVVDPILSDIAAGEAYGIIVAYNNGPNSYRLYGPFDGGTDFTYVAPLITFSVPLPAGVGDPVVSIFTWRSEAKPATDLTNLKITGNTITNLRGRGVAHYCVVHVANDLPAGHICTNNLIVSNNIFTGPYQLEGMIQANPLGGGAHTNGFSWSQDLTQSPSWVPAQLTVTNGTHYAPDDTLTASFLKEDSSVGTGHSIHQNETVQAGHTSNFFCIVSAPGVNGRYRLQLKNVTGAGDGTKLEVNLRAATAVASNVGTGLNAAGGILPYSYDQKTTSTWYKVWLTGTLDNTNARGSIFLEDNTGNPIYNGDGASGLYVWGCQYEEDATVPYVYMPTQSTPASSIGSQLISINGANNFVVSGNTLGPAAAQGIHTEDWATNGTISNNIVHDTGAVGIYLTDSRSIVVSNNIIRNSPTTCISLDYADPSPPILGADGAFGTTDYITLTSNICDAQSNPSMTTAYNIGAAGTDFHLEWSKNVARDLPAAAAFITWNNGADALLNTQEFPVPITVGQLGTCTLAKDGQRRYVSDASAGAYETTVAAGGTVQKLAICDGINLVWRAH